MGTCGRERIVAASAILAAGMLVGSGPFVDVSAFVADLVSEVESVVADVAPESEPFDWQPDNVLTKTAQQQKAIATGRI